MATFLRSVARFNQRGLLMLNRPPCVKSASYISTSEKKKDAHGSQPEIIGDPKEFEDWNKEENWISTGFDYKDRKSDRAEWLVGVNCVFGGIIWIGFIMAYKPGIYRDGDTVRREAYLLIEQRRRAGLPLIDKNYVDPDSINLPADEDIPKDFEIII